MVAAHMEEDPRIEIIRAAAELFMDAGFTATSIDAIAERLGATKGRIYHYYGSKAEIYVEIQLAAMNSMFAAVEPCAAAGGTARERLERMARAHVDVILRELPMHKVAVQGLELNSLSSTSPRHTRKLREVVRLRDEYEQLFCEVIDEGIRDGVFEDLPARMLAKPFFGSLNWLTIWYRPRRLQSEEDLQALIEMLTGFAVRGMLKEPARGRA